MKTEIKPFEWVAALHPDKAKNWAKLEKLAQNIDTNPIGVIRAAYKKAPVEIFTLIVMDKELRQLGERFYTAIESRKSGWALTILNDMDRRLKVLINDKGAGELMRERFKTYEDKSPDEMIRLGNFDILLDSESGDLKIMLIKGGTHILVRPKADNSIVITKGISGKKD